MLAAYTHSLMGREPTTWCYSVHYCVDASASACCTVPLYVCTLLSTVRVAVGVLRGVPPQAQALLVEPFSTTVRSARPGPPVGHIRQNVSSLVPR